MMLLDYCLLLCCLLGSSVAWITRPDHLPPVDQYGCPNVCDADFDVVFIIDRSGSISSSEYDLFEAAMKQLVGAFIVGQDHSHFGAVFFNETDSLGFHLDFSYDAATIKSNLDSPTGGLTNIAAGLRRARTDVLEGSDTMYAGDLKGDRPDVENLVFLFSDGVPNREEDQIPAESAALRAIAKVISVGIGLNSNAQTIMEGISTDNLDFFVSSFSELLAKVKEIIALACPSVDLPTACETKEINKKGWPDCFDWGLSMTSNDPNYPIKQSLARKYFIPDEHDRFGGFDANDNYPVFTFFFKPQNNVNCTNYLKYLRGQFTTHVANQDVHVTGWNGMTNVLDKNIVVGAGALDGGYQDFELDFQGQEVTEVRFQFNGAVCWDTPCSGINGLEGVYTQCCTVVANCSELCCHHGGHGEAPEDGCCHCVCPENYGGAFCQSPLVDAYVDLENVYDRSRNWQVEFSSGSSRQSILAFFATKHSVDTNELSNYFSFLSKDKKSNVLLSWRHSALLKYFRFQYKTDFAGAEITITVSNSEGVFLTKVITTPSPAASTFQLYELDLEADYSGAQVVTSIRITSSQCMTQPCFCFKDFFAVYLKEGDNAVDCCCQNGGTPGMGEYGCCQCCCPDGYTGTFCEDVMSSGEVTALTYQGGNNPDWYVNSTSTCPGHPVRQALQGDSSNDGFDFAMMDMAPIFYLQFRGSARYLLHFIGGYLTAANNNTTVTLVAYDKDGEIDRWEFVVHAVKTPFGVHLGALEVTRAEIRIKSCYYCPCLNIMGGFANYTKITDDDLECCCQNGGTATLDEFGCCDCICPDDFTGDFCEKSVEHGELAKWTYLGGGNPDWDISMSSTQSGHPLEESLKQQDLVGLCFDNYASWDPADHNQTYRINFNACGDCYYKLHYLEGQFYVPDANDQEVVTWTAYDANGDEIMSWGIIVRATGAQQYMNWGIDVYGFKVAYIELTIPFTCACAPCFGINAVYGVYHKICDAPLDCCCQNEGVGSLDENGCCQCQCPDNVVGDKCEKACVNKTIAKYTYFNNNNKHWTLTMSSAHPDHPPRKSLMRTFIYNNDPFDNFASFLVDGMFPTYRIDFNGTNGNCYFLHWIKGEFFTPVSGRTATLTVYGPGPPQVYLTTLNQLPPKQYQSWSFPIGVEVTHLEITFSHPCDIEDCYGINALQASYDVCSEVPTECCCQNGGTPTVTEGGCCACECPEEHPGEFCEEDCKTRPIIKRNLGAPWNTDWEAQISSEDVDYPIRKIFWRPLVATMDPFDQCGGFAEGDDQTLFTISFSDDATYTLHSLEGQFATASAGEDVVITAYNGAMPVMTWTYALDHTGYHEYQDWSIPIEKVVTHITFDYSGSCTSKRCFCINALRGKYTRCAADILGCCCINGGTATLTDNGCCECECPENVSGEFCETISQEKQIHKMYANKDAVSKYWKIEIKDNHEKNHYSRKVLRRQLIWNVDPFDSYGGFKKGDTTKIIRLQFQGTGTFTLHFLEGQFYSRYAGQKVNIKAYNGVSMECSTDITLKKGIYRNKDPADYKNFYISIGKEVTHVEFYFDGPCEKKACYGINDLYGEYTREYTTNLTTYCENTPCPDGYTVEFDEFANECCTCVEDPITMCEKKLDVALILDRSGSIGNSYGALKAVAVDIVGRFNVAPGETRFGVTLFSSNATVVIHLDNGLDFAGYAAQITSLPGPGGLTNMAEAFEDTRTMLFGTSGDRPEAEAPNACVLITDGNPNSRTDFQEQATLLKQMCTLTTVGIGSNIDATLLTALATDNKYLHSDSVDKLKDLLNEIITEACDTLPGNDSSP